MIRARIPEYQRRQLEGESQKTFAEEMTGDGHPISYADFRTLYARARKQVINTPKEREEIKSQDEIKEQPTPQKMISRADLEEIQNSEVDLKSLAKIGKRTKK